MGDPIVCRLTKQAVPSVAEIEACSDPIPWTKKQFINEFKHEHSRLWGARLDGKLRAFLLLHVLEQEAHILKLAVAEQWRRRRIGSALLAEVLEELRREGVSWATLEVRRSNEAAKRLYEAHGFSEIGERSAYYSNNGEDALILTCSLRGVLEGKVGAVGQNGVFAAARVGGRERV